jgi:hypothetical protein
MESTLLPEWEDVSKRTLTVGKEKGIPPSGFQSHQGIPECNEPTDDGYR